jgi:uncharacterized protein (TIGR00251 family)
MIFATSLPARPAPDGIVIALRLTPKAASDEVMGVESSPEGTILKAKVRAVPDAGQANSAAIALIARWLGVAKSQVSLVSGGKSRLKRLKIEGDPEVLLARIKGLLQG